MVFWRKAAAFASCAALSLTLLGCHDLPDEGPAVTASPSATQTASASEPAATAPAEETVPTVSTEPSPSAAASSAASTTPTETDFSKKDLNDTWGADAVQISLNGDSAECSSPAVTVDGSSVTVTAAGSYVLSGTLTDGQLLVEAGPDDDIQLVLNNASVTNSDGAAIHVKSADKVILTLPEGTENSMTDGAVYSDTSDDAPNAAVYSAEDLSINGTGSLTVRANCNNGIGTKDDLVIVNGNITVEAVNNGLKGKDSVSIGGGTFSITAGGDGIQSDKEDNAAKGWIIIDDGNFTITAGNDGIQAVSGLTIHDGSFTVATGGGAVGTATDISGAAGFPGNAAFPDSMPDGTMPQMPDNMTPPDFSDGMTPDDIPDGMIPPDFSGGKPWGRPRSENEGSLQEPDQMYGGNSEETFYGLEIPSDPLMEPALKTSVISTEASASDSYKGIKCDGSILVNGGSFTLNCADDAIHSNADVTLTAGSFEIATEDDGVHGDGAVTTRADIAISKCYEGIEGKSVTIEDGIIEISASDDGINAASGSAGGWGGGFGSTNAENVITVTGGSIRVTAGGDGFDSNGAIRISGGDITVLISSSADNEAMDCDGGLTVTGGNLIYGGTGTGSGPQTGSTQSYVFASGSFQAGQTVSVRKNGAEIISFEPAIACRSLIFSVPGMTAGESYEIYAGSELAAAATAGQGGTGMGGQGGWPGGGGNRPGGMRPGSGQGRTAQDMADSTDMQEPLMPTEDFFPETPERIGETADSGETGEDVTVLPPADAGIRPEQGN